MNDHAKVFDGICHIMDCIGPVHLTLKIKDELFNQRDDTLVRKVPQEQRADQPFGFLETLKSVYFSKIAI